MLQPPQHIVGIAVTPHVNRIFMLVRDGFLQRHTLPVNVQPHGDSTEVTDIRPRFGRQTYFNLTTGWAETARARFITIRDNGFI